MIPERFLFNLSKYRHNLMRQKSYYSSRQLEVERSNHYTIETRHLKRWYVALRVNKGLNRDKCKSTIGIQTRDIPSTRLRGERSNHLTAGTPQRGWVTLHLCIGKRSRESSVQVMTNRSFLIARFARVHLNFSLMNELYKQIYGFHGLCSPFRLILVYRHYLNRTLRLNVGGIQLMR